MSTIKFRTGFADFVCEDDSITTEANGYTLTATLERDYDTDPHDYDQPGWCFDTAGDASHSAKVRRQVARNKRLLDAWDRDEWHYFTVAILASVGDVELGRVAQLSGVEGNFPSRARNPNRHITAVANGLIPEAMAEAVSRLVAAGRVGGLVAAG